MYYDPIWTFQAQTAWDWPPPPLAIISKVIRPPYTNWQHHQWLQYCLKLKHELYVNAMLLLAHFRPKTPTVGIPSSVDCKSDYDWAGTLMDHKRVHTTDLHLLEPLRSQYQVHTAKRNESMTCCTRVWFYLDIIKYIDILALTLYGRYNLSLAGVATSIIFVTTKVLSWQDKHVCCNKTRLFLRHFKIMFVVTKVLLWQAYFCRNKRHVLLHMFVMTEVNLSWQNYVCCNKCLLRQKHVMTKVLSRQAYFCRDKRRVLLWQTRVCRDKTFVATKIILVSAPANDNN